MPDPDARNGGRDRVHLCIGRVPGNCRDPVVVYHGPIGAHYAGQSLTGALARPGGAVGCDEDFGWQSTKPEVHVAGVGKIVTPSAFDRKRWDSSAVMVTACGLPAAPMRRPSRSSVARSRWPSRSIESGSVMAWVVPSSSTRATFTLTPPISQPMELIPVLDLARGVAVHAVGGERSRYQPVRSALAPHAPGDALALARAYRGVPGVSRCYVADLDAIGGQLVQYQLLAQLGSVAGFNGPLLLDAGVASLADLFQLRGAGRHLVVGLETLQSLSDLSALAAEVEVTFSLDLRNDVPLARPAVVTETGSNDPGVLARAAIEAGATSLIVLDVGRVGRGVGLNLKLLAALRQALPGARLLAGGGVRDAGDLTALAECGCDGVLVATALHRGTIAARGPGPGQSGASEVR